MEGSLGLRYYEDSKLGREEKKRSRADLLMGARRVGWRGQPDPTRFYVGLDFGNPPRPDYPQDYRLDTQKPGSVLAAREHALIIIVKAGRVSREQQRSTVS